MRVLVKYSMLIISIISAMLLLLCYFIPSINPFEQPMSGLLAYIAPVMALVNIFFVLFWSLTRKFIFILIPVLALSGAWKVWSKYIAFNPGTAQRFEHSDSTFTLMSYNARLLDLYNWTGKKDTRTKMISYFQKKNPSILCLQEFYTGNDSAGFDNISAIKYACDYPYVAMCDVNVNKRGRWGSVVFSKLPIVQTLSHDVDVKGSNQLQQVDVLFNDDTVSLFNIHLKSNRFTTTESALVGKKELPEWNDTTLSRSRKIYNKVIQSTVSRGLEAELVSQTITHNSNHRIVCGDLNDIASSFVYFKIKGQMHDAFLEKGFGLGATYAAAVPLLRIDYLFYSDALHAQGFEVDHVEYTDHYPLMASFSLH